VSSCEYDNELSGSIRGLRDYQILKDYAPWRNLAYGYLTAGHDSNVRCLLDKLYVLHTYLKQKKR
jgi:hypothetical protein